MPCLRVICDTATPASPSFRIATICDSVNRDFFIGPSSPKSCQKSPLHAVYPSRELTEARLFALGENDFLVDPGERLAGARTRDDDRVRLRMIGHSLLKRRPRVWRLGPDHSGRADGQREKLRCVAPRLRNVEHAHA